MAASFWGLKLTPGLNFSKTVEQAFHISSATLDPKTSKSDEITSVAIDYEDEEQLICNLSLKHGILQVPLDLQFNEGDHISFRLRGGHAHIHLTGYKLFLDDMSESDVEDEEDLEDELPVAIPKKRKLEDTVNENQPKLSKSAAKRARREEKLSSLNKSKNIQDKTSKNKQETSFSTTTTSPKKKLKDISTSDLLQNGSFDESDDDDEDFDIDIDDDEETDEGDEEEEEDDDVEEEEEEDDEEEEEDSDEEIEKLNSSKKNTSSPLSSKINATFNAAEQQKICDETRIVGKSKKKKNKDKNGMSTPDRSSPKSDVSKSATGTPKTIKSGGVVCQDLKVGGGPEAKHGKLVTVYYEGRLKNGNVFDKQMSGQGLKFRLGQNEVIKGWDVGINGLKVGGKRRLTIPPNMGYGKRGAAPEIPPNSTLVFDVELRSVK